MIKRLVAVCALAGTLTAPATAQDAVSDHIGLLGVGYFTSEAPIGLRYWTGPTTGFDLGFGFTSSTKNPIIENGTASTTSLVSYAFELGYLKVLSSDSNMLTFLRPGVLYAGEQMIVPAPVAVPARGTAQDQVKETETRLSVSLMLGAELFMGKFGFPNLSFGGGVGAAFTSTSPAGDGESRAVISTVLADVSVVENAVLGFHFYF